MAREFRHAPGERKTYTYHQTYIHTYEPTYKAEQRNSERHENVIDRIIDDFRMGLWRRNLLEADIEFYNKRLAQLDSLRIKLEDTDPSDYSTINIINSKKVLVK
jgi:hypothetical protein